MRTPSSHPPHRNESAYAVICSVREAELDEISEASYFRISYYRGIQILIARMPLLPRGLGSY